MLSPKDQQIEICLLKSGLEEIENKLILQRSALPELDAENEQKQRESMAALKAARYLLMETERLKLKNVKLTAQRLELKRQCDEISKSLDKALENRSELVNQLKQEEQDIGDEICKYEESLHEKADRFRQTRRFYNEEEMKNEIVKVDEKVVVLESEVANRKNTVERLQRQLQGLQADVPETILTIVGKTELEERVKYLTEKCESLQASLA